MQPTRAQLEHHDVWVSSDRVWQRGLRLLQSLWREEQGLPPGVHPRGGGGASRPLGSRLRLPDAQEQLSNYLTHTIREVVHAELDRADEEGKLFSAPRIYDDLLSSQPLCFNLFGELKADLRVASAFARHLWPDRVKEVTRLEFEHSPGRGDDAYLGNRTAFDVYLEHTVPGGGEGFIGVEVKYHERLDTTRADNRGRPTEVARRSGLFEEKSLEELDRPPLQQLWFDHLLALSMLQQDVGRWAGNGLFVLLHPAANQPCYAVAAKYQQQLHRTDSFQRLTLEEVIGALRLVDGRDWVDEVDGRYLDYGRIRRQG